MKTNQMVVYALVIVIAIAGAIVIFGVPQSVFQGQTETSTLPFCSEVGNCKTQLMAHGLTQAQVDSMGIECTAGVCIAKNDEVR